MIDYKMVTTVVMDKGIDGKVTEHIRNGQRLCAGDLVLSPACQKVLLDAISIAKGLDHRWLGNEHLLLAMAAPLATGGVAELKIDPRVVCAAFAVDIKEAAKVIEEMSQR